MSIDPIVLLGISAILFILLVLCVILIGLQSKKTRMGFLHATDELKEKTAQMTYELSHLSNDQQKEVSDALRSGNDSLLNTLQAITTTQSEQLDRLARQMAHGAREQEERLDRLHKNTEDSLKKYDVRMESITRTLDEKLHANEGRIEKMRETLESGISRMQRENGEKLDQMRTTVDEKLHETLDKRLSESFSQVSERLEQVYKGLGEMQNLAAGVGDLKKVLTNVKTRGIWGEMQLGTLLAQMLTSSQYEENVAVSKDSQERVEFAVKLPGQGDGTVYLPIDSKFPQEAYGRLVDATEMGDREAIDLSRKELILRLNEEGKRIAAKYIKPPETTDFAIMFLPTEGLYAELMRDMSTAENLQTKYRVVVAGPSTLAALLNSLQMGFRTLAIEQRSGEVWKLLGAVKTDFSRFSSVLEKTQSRLRQASESIDSAFVQTRKIERHLKKVESLEQGEAENLLGSMED